MTDQKKHTEQSGSAEEKKAIQGAENAAANAQPSPEAAPAAPGNPDNRPA